MGNFITKKLNNGLADTPTNNQSVNLFYSIENDAFVYKDSSGVIHTVSSNQQGSGSYATVEQDGSIDQSAVGKMLVTGIDNLPMVHQLTPGDPGSRGSWIISINEQAGIIYPQPHVIVIRMLSTPTDGETLLTFSENNSSNPLISLVAKNSTISSQEVLIAGTITDTVDNLIPVLQTISSGYSRPLFNAIDKTDLDTITITTNSYYANTNTPILGYSSSVTVSDTGWQPGYIQDESTWSQSFITTSCNGSVSFNISLSQIFDLTMSPYLPTGSGFYSGFKIAKNKNDLLQNIAAVCTNILTDWDVTVDNTNKTVIVQEKVIPTNGTAIFSVLQKTNVFVSNQDSLTVVKTPNLMMRPFLGICKAVTPTEVAFDTSAVQLLKLKSGAGIEFNDISDITNRMMYPSPNGEFERIMTFDSNLIMSANINGGVWMALNNGTEYIFAKQMQIFKHEY